MERLAFLITIDTEEDDAWSNPREVTTRNGAYLGRFQSLCESRGQRPTYLTNWQMAHCPEFVELGRKALSQGTAEIGLHLHAWNAPPIEPITDDDVHWHPYLVEYPEPLLREKLRRTHDALVEAFGCRPVSHRAGRWAFDGTYARALIDLGYRVDCSVTPHVSWRDHLGRPDGNGGSDYTTFPTVSYFIDPDAIDRPGSSPLLEVPMTIVRSRWPAPVEWLRPAASRVSIGSRVMDRFFPQVSWLRPNGRNLASMLRILDRAVAEGRDYVEFMLHSSEFMPGCSPTFTSEESIEALYRDLEELFDAAADRFEGMTLSAYHERVASTRT